jgi:hypothetical protein
MTQLGMEKTQPKTNSSLQMCRELLTAAVRRRKLQCCPTARETPMVRLSDVMRTTCLAIVALNVYA